MTFLPIGTYSNVGLSKTSIYSLKSVVSLKFLSNEAEHAKKQVTAQEIQRKASWKERFYFAEDNTLFKENFIDSVISSLGLFCEVFKPLKIVLGPILMTRYIILYTLGLVASSQTIKKHFQEFPWEQRKVRWVHWFLSERQKETTKK